MQELTVLVVHQWCIDVGANVVGDSVISGPM